MRILLIKPKHIGDTLILTPTITGLKQAHPDAEIWVVVRRGTEGILAGCPGIHRILTVVAVEKRERHWADFFREVCTLRELRKVVFDYIIELGDGSRGRLFTVLARSKHRYTVNPADGIHPTKPHHFTAVSKLDWKTLHRVEKDYYTVSEFLPLALPIPPLRFDREFTQSWEPAEKLAEFGVIQIGKRQVTGRWYREGWEEVGRWLLKRYGAVIIVSGPADYEIQEAIWLQDRLGPRVLCTLGRASWAQVAGLLYRARIYVGLDTATTHLAAACGCPAVALFGPTFEGHWRPWRAAHRIVTTTGDLTTGDILGNYLRSRGRLMKDISAQQVISACEDLLATSTR